MVNVFLDYADDIVLSPSWKALQFSIDILDFNRPIKHIDIVSFVCNISKTVCMLYKSICRHKVVCGKCPAFMLSGQCLQFIRPNEFKYFGKILNNIAVQMISYVKCVIYMQELYNVFNRRFSKCSSTVKLILFNTCCLRLYDSAPWTVWTTFNTGQIESML